MNQQNLHSYYLDAMGIVQWRLRHQPQMPDQKTYPAHYYHLSNANVKGLFIADAKSLSDQGLQKEQELLQAMSRAIKMDAEGKCIRYSNPEIFDQSQYAFVILLGAECQQNLAKFAASKTKLVIRSHSLSTLLEEPKLKADTWRLLQPILKLVD